MSNQKKEPQFCAIELSAREDVCSATQVVGGGGWVGGGGTMWGVCVTHLAERQMLTEWHTRTLECMRPDQNFQLKQSD